MDALGTAVGVASLGIQICQGLLSYYDGWKDYHTDISSTYQSIADLAQTFTILKTSLIRSITEGKSKESKEILEGRARVGSCLNSCTEGLNRLQTRLSQLRTYGGEPQGLRQKTWAEVQRAWYPLRSRTVAKLKEDVGELKDSLSLALQTLQQITLDRDFNYMTDRMSEFLSNQQAADNKMSTILSSQELAKQKDIIDWLSPPDPYYNHYAACKRRVPGTGTWLLGSEQYKHWKTSTDDGMLWLTGKAGCGKTVLCSTVIEDIRTLPGVQLAFFYVSFSDIHKQEHAGLMASLIAQLSQGRAVFEKLQQAYDKLYPSKPSTETLEELLLACLQQPGQTVLVLDALDELPEGDDMRSAVLDWLGRLMQNTHQKKLFVTSRQLTDIQASFASLGAGCVLLRPDIANNDIWKYVTTELETHPKLSKLNVNMKQEIKEAFRQKADGMFRWAFCQLERLKGLKSTKPKFIKMVLNDLPDTLDETYERMLLQIDKMLWDEALAALRWLAFETRPLTLGELAEACLINYTGDGEEFVDVDNRGEVDEILDILAGLILIEDSHGDSNDSDTDDSNDKSPQLNSTGEDEQLHLQQVNTNSRVRLAHFSVKEFLCSSRILDGKAANFALRKERDHWILAQSCLVYVLYYSESSSKALSWQDFSAFPLLKYAAKTWTALIPKCDRGQPAHQIRLLESEQHRQNWLAIYQPDDSIFRPFTAMTDVEPALYCASCIGLIHTCEVLLDKGADIDAQGGVYGNALQAASVKGHEQVVKLLLNRGADTNIRGGSYGYTLQAALGEGNHRIVQLLLDAGADVSAQGGWFGSALQAASRRGNEEAVQLLLGAGADVNAQGGYYGNALQAASSSPFPSENLQEVMKLLLDAGADVNARGGYYGNALQAVSSSPFPAKDLQEMMKLLLDAGADVNAQGGRHSNALQGASEQGHQERVKLLLDAGADVNAQADGSINALEVVEDTDLLEALLPADNGTDIKGQRGYYNNALQAASARGHKEVIKLLLSRGADVNAQGGYYGNALQAASVPGDQEAVKLLLDAGANVNAQGGRHINALQAASVQGHQEVVNLLIAAGAQSE